MANTQLVDTPWLDILPPPAPADQSLLIALVTISIIVFVLFRLYMLWQGRPRQASLRQLKQLQRRFEEKEMDNKICLFEINRLLRHGFGHAQLRPLDEPNWQAFYQQLVKLQYQAKMPGTDDTRQLIHDAGTILRNLKP